MKKLLLCLLALTLFLSACAPADIGTPETTAPPVNNDTTPSTEQTDNTSENKISNEEKYKAVLDIYKNTITNLDEKINSKDSPYSEGTKEYEWWSAILSAAASFHLSTNVPGYAFRDLNRNGNDEMILLLDDYTVLAIFSFADEQPVLLDDYWNRKKCTIEQDGSIQVYGSSGADTSSFSIYKISNNDKTLVLSEEYGTDGYDPETLVPCYYKISNGTKTPITVLEYAAAFSQGVYSSIEDLAEHTKQNAELEFVPLGLDVSYKRIFERILNYKSKIESVDKYLWQLYFSFGSGTIGSLDAVDICYLDMDGDGIKELLLRSDIHDHIILRYQEGKIYSYEISWKEMGHVYEDGSFSWSSPTYLEDNSRQYGISKLTFNKDNLKWQSLYTIFEGENESYFTINRKLASKSEIDALIENRENIKEVTWTSYPLDPDKIPSVG